MNIIFYDSPNAFLSLQPFTLTRPICEIRIGILKIREKWIKALEKSLNIAEVGYQTMPYLQAKYPLPHHQENAQYLFINSCFLPHQDWLPEINHLLLGEGILYQDMPIAWRSSHTENSLEHIKQWKNIGQDPTYLQNTWDIFLYNAQEIQQDFTSITHGRSSASISDPHTICYNKENIFIEEGAKIKAAILNAEKGVIYIGKNTEIQELSVIHGNFALCEGAVLNMGTKIKGDTTIGEYSKVGGEISNSVIFGYSNKGHEGFLGNSVIGEWCNLGADTNTSNLRNNYGQVKVWNYAQGQFVNSFQQFVGLMMGDHSKAGINTMFNTGTVVGVSANIFGGDFPPKYIPSFAWGGAQGFEKYQLEKAYETAQRVMERRKKTLDEYEKKILQYVYEITQL